MHANPIPESRAQLIFELQGNRTLGLLAARFYRSLIREGMDADWATMGTLSAVTGYRMIESVFRNSARIRHSRRDAARVCFRATAAREEARRIRGMIARYGDETQAQAS